MKRLTIIFIYLLLATATQSAFAQTDTIVEFIQSEQYIKFFGADYPYLKEAEKKYIEANIRMKESMKLGSEAEGYKMESESVLDPKRKKDLESKWKTKEEQAQSLQFSAYNLFANANMDKLKIYDKFFKYATWPNITPEQVVSRQNAQIIANGEFERAVNFRKISEKLPSEQKLDNYYRADSLELGALKLMESFLESFLSQQVEYKEVPNFKETPEFKELFKAEEKKLKEIAKLEFIGDSLIALGTVSMIKSQDESQLASNTKRKFKRKKIEKRANAYQSDGLKYKEKGYLTLDKARSDRYELYKKYLTDVRMVADPNQLKKGAKQEKDIEVEWVRSEVMKKNIPKSDLKEIIPIYKTADSLQLIVLSNLEKLLGSYSGYNIDDINTDVQLSQAELQKMEESLKSYADTLGRLPYWVESIFGTIDYIDSQRDMFDKEKNPNMKRFLLERILNQERSIASSLSNRITDSDDRNSKYFRNYKDKIAKLGTIDINSKFYGEGVELQKEIESGFQASKRNIQNAYSIHETKVSPELYETTKNAPAYGGYKILQYTQYKINRLRVILNLLESEKLDIEDTIKVVRLYNLYKGISLGDQLNAENLKKQQEQKKNEQKQHSGNKDKPKSNPNLSFSIQIASFENPQIPPDKSEFREYKTDEVRVERLHNGTAYVVGKLTYEQTADELRKALNFGYSDAFKVAYLNGIRISMEEAEAIMRGDKNTKPPINTVSASDNAILFDKKLAEKIVTGEDISKTKGLVYSVYIGSFQKDVAWKEIKNISPIYKDLSAAGVIKYNAGLYHTKNAAIAVLASVKKAGLKDAYVVAFNDGKRIGLQEQIKTVANIVFSVQISVGSSELSAADKAKFEALKKYGELDKRSLGNNTALYSIGKFSSFSDADGAKNKIVAEGIKDAFVIALKNGVEIPVSEALKELKK